uniref:Uncharacterized protein n=1 Tax=Chlamydomonas leiostraca TaxID=1034604 RepID=A0A7S0WPP5_9CHLO|mmetsp:Transcript_22236/g.56534  ORF Transcript_22236/g.56534 Transcript_22236/m.56534 type:complete len:213 (+) Transcript_22236:53-691(+)
MAQLPEIASPSTLSYRDRLRLREKDSNAYSALYCTSNSYGGVHSRLYGDATSRQLRSSQQGRPSTSMPWPEYLSTSETFFSRGNLSGFCTNTTKAIYTPGHTFRVGHRPDDSLPDVNSLVPEQLRRYKAKEPFEYLAAIRKDCETTNQTLRMMGTYETDYAHARRSHTFIANSCPGGPAFFHPDVRVTGAAAGPGTLPYTLGRPVTVMSSRW